MRRIIWLIIVIVGLYFVIGFALRMTDFCPKAKNVMPSIDFDIRNPKIPDHSQICKMFFFLPPTEIISKL